MQFLRENLLLMTVYMLIFWSNDWLMNRIMKGGKFGRVFEGAIHCTVFMLLFSLISVMAVFLGVGRYFPQNDRLTGPLMMATVSALVLLFLVKKLAQEYRSIEGTELHSK